MNRCEIDSSEAAVYIKLCSTKQKLMFEMLPGIRTENFVGEIFRLAENTSNGSFKWLETYIQGNGKLFALQPGIHPPYKNRLL